jgi:type I restriction enzyme M protein
MAEGQCGGEFFTPRSLVKLIVEVIEPFHGRILDPACGSGGMFVQSARFIRNHQKDPGSELSIFGQEKVLETVRLCRMNLAVHGLSGDIRQANTYYENVHNCRGRFDFVMANPPFNVDGVDREKIKDDPRYQFGIPTVDNANYLWIQDFYSALNERGRAGFVMANSASDARGSELEIRKKIIESGAVDVIISIGPNFFYTVTLPCTLWFFDRAKASTDRKDKVLFIDARQIFTQVSRALREFTPAQIEFIANIVRLYRGQPTENREDSEELMKRSFPEGKYVDVPGLCKAATVQEIEEQGWSLNPGRYVGVSRDAVEEFDFVERLAELGDELDILSKRAHGLESNILENMRSLLEETEG